MLTSTVTLLYSVKSLMTESGVNEVFADVLMGMSNCLSAFFIAVIEPSLTSKTSAFLIAIFHNVIK